MKRFIARARSEPAMVAAVLNVAIAQASAQGFHLTTGQVGLIYSLVSLGLGVAVRQQVRPVSKGPPPKP